MKQLLIAPVFVVMFLGFATQLVDIAESSSAKTLDYTKDMNDAIDCAVRGIDLSVCSPNLMNYDFEEEIDKTIKVNEEIIETLSKYEDNITNYCTYFIFLNLFGGAD